MLVEDVAESGLESASIVKPPVDCSSTRTRILWSMLHGSSILASRRKERVQKAALVDHHGPGDARLRTMARGRGKRLCALCFDDVRAERAPRVRGVHEGLRGTLGACTLLIFV